MWGSTQSRGARVTTKAMCIHSLFLERCFAVSPSESTLAQFTTGKMTYVMCAACSESYGRSRRQIGHGLLDAPGCFVLLESRVTFIAALRLDLLQSLLSALALCLQFLSTLTLNSREWRMLRLSLSPSHISLAAVPLSECQLDTGATRALLGIRRWDSARSLTP